MTFTEYSQYDATALIDLVKQGAVTAAELMDIAIARAESVNPQLNAIVEPLYEMGRTTARQDLRNTPFAGIPLLVKDLGLEMAGQRVRAGSRFLEDYRSAADSYLIQRYKTAGFSIFGKTNTPEFGLNPFTESELYGPAHNPWKPGYTTGGSSGGSAAAVAAGIVPIATASDGGGSIRMPASCCGVFGLKPSRGRLTLGPHNGASWNGATVEGCITRSVRDAALFYELFQGPSPGDPYYAPAPARPYREEILESPGQLRIGFSTQHTLGAPVAAPCQAAVAHTAQLLESLGHHVEEVALPYEPTDLTEIFLTMIVGQVNATVRRLETLMQKKIRPGDIEETTYALYLLGAQYSAGDYALQQNRWNLINRRVGQFHENYDLLLTPTLALEPFPIGTLQASDWQKRLLYVINRLGLGFILKGQIGPLAEQTYSFMPWTPLCNMTGQPAMSVPLYQDDKGLPIGTMLSAPLYREDMLFRLAAQLEQAQPFGRVAGM